MANLEKAVRKLWVHVIKWVSKMLWVCTQSPVRCTDKPQQRGLGQSWIIFLHRYDHKQKITTLISTQIFWVHFCTESYNLLNKYYNTNLWFVKCKLWITFIKPQWPNREKVWGLKLVNYYSTTYNYLGDYPLLILVIVFPAVKMSFPFCLQAETNVQSL